MIETIKNNVINLIDNIEEMVICFYQQKKEQGYAKLDGTLNLLGNVMDELAYLKRENEKMSINLDGMNIALNHALVALQEKDTILFSDILNYELLPQLREVAIII